MLLTMLQATTATPTGGVSSERRLQPAASTYRSPAEDVIAVGTDLPQREVEPEERALLPSKVGSHEPAVVAKLNAQYWDGRPSNDLRSAGVVVRGFDALDDSVNGGSPWLPISKAYPDKKTAYYWDHWCASLINRDTPAVWAGGGWGFVFNPDAIELKCAYPGEFSPPASPAASHAPMDLEAASPQRHIRRTRSHTAPPFYAVDASLTIDKVGPLVSGCHNPENCPKDLKEGPLCAYPPSQLKDALDAQEANGKSMQHNELVIDLLNMSPPDAILGVYHLGDPTKRLDAVKVHSDFMAAYGMTEPSGFPLLRLQWQPAPGDSWIDKESSTNGTKAGPFYFDDGESDPLGPSHLSLSSLGPTL